MWYIFRYGGGASLGQPIRTTRNHFRQNPVHNPVVQTPVYTPVAPVRKTAVYTPTAPVRKTGVYTPVAPVRQAAVYTPVASVRQAPIYSPVRQAVVNTAFPVHGAAYGAPTRRFGRFRGRRFPRRFAGRGRGGLRSSRFGNSFRTARFDNQPFRNSRFDNAQLGRFGLGVQY